jgi:general secretion pathway protein I
VRDARGFTLVEVLVALMVVAIGLAALMVAVSGTARSSAYLRDKTLAQWIALNRLTQVRLNMTKFGQNTDKGELVFAGRTWHYDTRYFDTSIATMTRVDVRVYEGNAKAKGNPLAEATGFLGKSFTQPGTATVDWNQPITPPGTPTVGTPTTPTPVTSTPVPPNTNGQPLIR